MGELLRAREHLEMVISLHDRERHGTLASLFVGIDPKVNCLGYSGMALWTLGYPDQALKRGNEGVAFAQELTHPHSLASAECFLGNIHLFRREARAAQEAAARVRLLSAEHGFALWLALAPVLRGWAMARQGHNEKLIPEMEEGLALFRATGAEIGRPFWLCGLAEALFGMGRLEDGQNTLAEALAGADETEGRQYQSEICRLRGELSLRQNDSNAGEAQRWFERAIDVARKQSARSLELRATTSLARLLAKNGRRDEARAMLAEIYGWFTEGFDTADLKEAKALLDELRA
jgi:predicted ATPase